MSFLAKIFPIDDLVTTARRFPLSVICALALFIVAVLEIHDVWDIDEDLLARVGTVLACSYFWLGIAKVVRESLALDAVKQHVIGGLGVVLFAAIACSGPQWGMHFCFLFPALLLSLMFAPYLKGGDDLSVWFYNRKLWVGVAISYIALLLLAGGACMALWAVSELFEVRIQDEFYGDIWAFAGLVVGPIYALYWVPKRFEYTKEDCNDPPSPKGFRETSPPSSEGFGETSPPSSKGFRETSPPGLKFIVNWISAPMVFVYLTILYAYFARIFITGEVPNGHLAYMISGFIGAGIVTYLAAHPLRDEGTVQLKVFYKIFFAAIIVPVGFHIYAIWERIGAYGVTEQRYMLAIAALWFAFLALGNLKGRMDIRLIPMVLAGLLLLASFGPWGAVSVSGASQKARLDALVAEYGLVVDGKARAAEEDLPYEVRADISSILTYICRTERDRLIEDWFDFQPGKNFKPFECTASDLTKQMGFDYIADWQRERKGESGYFYLNPSYSESVLDIRGYDTLVRHISSAIKVDDDGEKSWSFKYARADSAEEVSVRYDESWMLRIDIGARAGLELDVQAFAKEKLGFEENNRTLIYEGQNDSVIYRLEFDHIKGNREDGGAVEPESVSFDLYYRLKD